ncbi:Putative multidrug export ATP-binding/permease protein [Jeotgalicoccus aerolatus]|uniref:ATP-binding cassette subfamily B protein n=1 Tax=Jeotgalicoccus aerolatus TaxID=709510 RepID=A0ABS4HPL3_9STAP|nr:ABC transporter ATP-binding protein [Jeotgalicoccus aerolatus]MBP1952865.1 ATP-binding cassette subfamily B protein [Jeotgalicoccus aerolatus]GGE07417.1 multidrug ABC transporter ATP-binding protein [Jeotgalicoccus aerolatus]CAD2080428.1 Putative multidrug export ATP-binding/permease protein [Jeotgalicoccus aerolatus]
MKKFLSYYAPYKVLFTVDFLSAVIVGLLELAFPVIVSTFIDELLPTGNWQWILIAALGLVLIYLFNTLMQFIVTYWGHMLGTNIERDIRNDLYRHIQKLSFRFFDNTKTGKLLTRLTNDLMNIGEMAHHGPEDLFIAIMTLLGAFGIMYYIHPELAIIAFIIVPLILVIAIYFNKKMTVAFRELFGRVSEFNHLIGDKIGGIRLVQAFASEEKELQEFKKINDRFRATKLKAYKIMSFNTSSTYMLMRLVTVFILIAGAYYVMRGELSYGEFAAFILISNVLFKPLEKINAVIELYPNGIAGFKHFLDTMAVEPDIKDKEDARDLTNVRGSISYDNVSFKYEEKNVLSDISFNIAPGETIAFVGPSGAGKTTLCSLLPRFYEVSDGSIKIDGQDIRDLTLSSLRENIGTVQQDVFLFAGTLKENVAYGKPDATDEEVYDALEKAQLKELVDSYRDGLDTIVGERGVKLSGGQKQRIAIARMFLKNPPILVLDEATSALDTATEMYIQDALNRLAEGRTTLVIAHRLATIKNADRIMVVTPDGISESGTHDELLSIDAGIYKGLHQAQFGQI